MLNELENKIRKAIPELMELGVGTKFIDYNNCNAQILYNHLGTLYYFTESDNEVFTISEHFKESIVSDIIGKPIQLNHVSEYVLEILGIFNEDILKELYFLWNLKNNLLSEQSEELIKYINEL